MNIRIGIILSCAVLLAGCTMPAFLNQRQVLESEQPTTEKPPLKASLKLSNLGADTTGARIRYSMTDAVPLSGLALRLMIPIANVQMEENPFDIPEAVEAKSWRPLINTLDCQSNEQYCYADLALITLSTEGSDFVNLDSVAILKSTVVAPELIHTISMDQENSLATTKTADPIQLDFSVDKPTQ